MNLKIIMEGATESEIVKRLKSGDRLKFVPLVLVDLEAEELVLLLSLGEPFSFHEYLLLSWHDIRKQSGVSYQILDLKPTGGLVKIENDKLVFYDSSFKFGKYDEALLQKIDQQQLLNLFMVNSVSYE